MASKIEKLRRLENAPEFRRVPLSQGPVTFPSSSLLPFRDNETKGSLERVAA